MIRRYANFTSETPQHSLEEAPVSQVDNIVNTAIKALEKIFGGGGPPGLSEAVAAAPGTAGAIARQGGSKLRDVLLDQCAAGDNSVCTEAEKLQDMVQASDTDEGAGKLIVYLYKTAEERAKAKEEEKKRKEEEKKKKKKKEDATKAGYGIDPDGPFGPMPNPCQGMGPMCR